MCSVKLAKSLHKILYGDFKFGVKIKHTHPGGYPTTRISALRPILGLWQSHLSYTPENHEFNNFYKIMPYSKGVDGGNQTYHINLQHRA